MTTASWQAADCPTCGQPKGHKCRSRKTQRTTDTHVARIDAANRERRGW